MTMKKLILILLGLGVILGLGLLMVSRFTDYMGEYDGRTLYAVELGALNITNLFLPAPNNIFSGLDKMVAVLTDIDNPQACDATEMGVLTGIGLLYSILHVFRFQKTEDIREQILEICGKCNCFLILLAVKGGLASVIASYITTGIRNYNRVGIFIDIIWNTYGQTRRNNRCFFCGKETYGDRFDSLGGCFAWNCNFCSYGLYLQS